MQVLTTACNRRCAVPALCLRETSACVLLPAGAHARSRWGGPACLGASSFWKGGEDPTCGATRASGTGTRNPINSLSTTSKFQTDRENRPDIHSTKDQRIASLYDAPASRLLHRPAGGHAGGSISNHCVVAPAGVLCLPGCPPEPGQPDESRTCARVGEMAGWWRGWRLWGMAGWPWHSPWPMSTFLHTLQAICHDSGRNWLAA